MGNLMKDIKETINRIFRKKGKEEEPPAKIIHKRENVVSKENHAKKVGSEKVTEDVGKKVFEKTGHAGVGQSSTLEPQKKEGTKTAHGRRKYYHKKTKHVNKEAGKMPEM